MKEKIVSLVLAMTLVLAYAVPVAATDADTSAPNEVTVTEETAVPDEAADTDTSAPNETTVTEKTSVSSEAATAGNVVSEDPQVQAAYEAYLEMEDALSVNEYGPLKDAYDKFTAIKSDFTDAQSDEWDRVVTDVIGYKQVVSVAISANMIINTVAKMEAYQANPNAKTATDFVYMYEECVDAGISIDLFDPDIKGAYETAKSTDVPSENVLKVYDAYADLAEALELLAAGYYDEDFIAACENFETVLDIVNELTEAELTDLACLMEVEDGETAFYTMLSDWINANLALELGALYDAWEADQNEETAAAFVEKYEEILNDTALLTKADKKVILTSFTDAYETAKAFLAEAEKSGKDTSPETGDDFNAAPYAALAVMAAAAAGLAAKRRKAQ